MPISLKQLVDRLKPADTSLLLGAGASIPSGAPSGKELARKLWEIVAKDDPQSEDLIESASILERRYSRRVMADAVIQVLTHLQPSGGILGLPALGWHAIFTTNFDELIERAYSKANVPLVRIRSNFDLTYRESRTDVTLYKIHGCVSQDRSLGHKGSMILTEQDYDDFNSYRQSLFSLFKSHLLTGDVLIIGQSLADRHLSDLVKEALKGKQDGAPGEVYVLVYNQDDLRAPLLEDRGARIAFGSIDEFIHEMMNGSSEFALEEQTEPADVPVSLVSTVENVESAKLHQSNVVKMFNGSPASYADIREGAVFEKTDMAVAADELQNRKLASIAIVGAAGVGKTTLARQLCYALHERGMLAFEHKADFQFLSKPWLEFEAKLREKGQRAVLMLDECTRYLRQANLLIEHLTETDNSAICIVLTANAAQWGPRLKTPSFFSHGRLLSMSRLPDAELHSLINLVDQNKAVSALVQQDFKSLNREQKFSRLRERCSADMFVCLSNIFANDSLDQILLTEYAELDEEIQEYYRYIAALESVGMRVHRQLIMRMLCMPADAVKVILSRLSGIVDEFDINPKQGVYGWATRHIVIARKITEYKFSSLDELENLFGNIIDNINPAVPTELQSIRDLCDTENGIGRLGEPAVRKKLYRRLIQVVPGERIPWHRLIRELLFEDDFEEAGYAIRQASEAVGIDGPIDRYKVRLLVSRAEKTPGIMDADRLALLRQAYEMATNNIDRHKADKHAYRVLCQVAQKLVEKGETPHVLDEAVTKMRAAANVLLDPDFDAELRQYEGIYGRLR